MATIDTTVGGSSANSYAGFAGANAYFSESLGRQAWAARSQSDREIALIHATRVLDQYMVWQGYKASDDQALEWPRTDAYDKVGLAIDSSVIPMPVVFATYELAYHLLTNGGIGFEQQTLDKIRLGSVEVDFTERSTDSGIPRHVEILIQHLGDSTIVDKGAVRMARLVRS